MNDEKIYSEEAQKLLKKMEDKLIYKLIIT